MSTNLDNIKVGLQLKDFFNELIVKLGKELSAGTTADTLTKEELEVLSSSFSKILGTLNVKCILSAKLLAIVSSQGFLVKSFSSTDTIEYIFNEVYKFSKTEECNNIRLVEGLSKRVPIKSSPPLVYIPDEDDTVKTVLRLSGYRFIDTVSLFKVVVCCEQDNSLIESFNYMMCGSIITGTPKITVIDNRKFIAIDKYVFDTSSNSVVTDQSLAYTIKAKIELLS